MLLKVLGEYRVSGLAFEHGLFVVPLLTGTANVKFDWKLNQYREHHLRNTPLSLSSCLAILKQRNLDQVPQQAYENIGFQRILLSLDVVPRLLIEFFIPTIDTVSRYIQISPDNMLDFNYRLESKVFENNIFRDVTRYFWECFSSHGTSVINSSAFKQFFDLLLNEKWVNWDTKIEGSQKTFSQFGQYKILICSFVDNSRFVNNISTNGRFSFFFLPHFVYILFSPVVRCRLQILSISLHAIFSMM